MTGRPRLALAGTALAVAAVGVAARPFLPTGRPPRPTATTTPASAPSPDAAAITAATTVAIAAAASALACQPHPTTTPTLVRDGGMRSAGWCGRFTVTRSQPLCAEAGGACEVELIGTLNTTATTPAGVALAVTVQDDGGRWHAVAVHS